MTTPAATARALVHRLLPLAVIFVAVGLSTSAVGPFMALFLANELDAGPARVTLFLVVAPVSAVAVSTLVARWSDRVGLRHRVLAVAAGCGCAGAVTTAVVRDYWVLLAVAVTLNAAAAAVMPQSFAYAREALGTDPRTGLAMSTLRTLFSVAWVAGPSLAAFLLSWRGFVLTYGVAATMYAVTGAVALGWLRRRPGAAPLENATVAAPLENATGAAPLDNATVAGAAAATAGGPDAPRHVIWLTVGAFALLQCAATLGVQAMPLFLEGDLHGTVGEAGLILGLCAAVEIPFMIGFGALSGRTPLRRLLLVGAASHIAYFTLVSLSVSGWQLAVGQLLNAVYVAAIGGLGVTYVQDMLPHHRGRASTLFSNAFPVGQMLAAPILGVAAAVGYRAAYGSAAALGVTAFLALAAARPRIAPAGARPATPVLDAVAGG